MCAGWNTCQWVVCLFSSWICIFFPVKKRPFNPVRTCLCIMWVTGKEHSGHTAASQSPFCCKCPSAHYKFQAGMRQQRSDLSVRAMESPHGWLRSNRAQSKADTKRIYEFQLAETLCVYIYLSHSFSKPFPHLHRKRLGKTETFGHTETFVCDTIPWERHFSCVNLIFFLLCRHEWDIFTIICSLWRTGSAPRPIFY